jgi:hypothetical protein
VRHPHVWKCLQFQLCHTLSNHHCQITSKWQTISTSPLSIILYHWTVCITLWTRRDCRLSGEGSSLRATPSRGSSVESTTSTTSNQSLPHRLSPEPQSASAPPYENLNMDHIAKLTSEGISLFLKDWLEIKPSYPNSIPNTKFLVEIILLGID